MARIPLMLVAATLALAGGGVRAAPRDLVAEVTARAAERGVAPEGLVEPVQEAQGRGLPAELVADKVLEGLAKGVAPERVGAVAGALVARLAEADAVLADAAARGLAPSRDRAAALADLAHAFGAGVDPGAVRGLADAARGGGGSSDGVVAATAALGALARRGVVVGDALPLGRALARSPAAAPEVAPAFDAWRTAGGDDARAFLAEAERRVTAGRRLAGAERDEAGGAAADRRRERDGDRDAARERREERGRMRLDPSRGGHDRRH